MEGILKLVKRVLKEVTEEQHDYQSRLLGRLCRDIQKKKYMFVYM